MDDGEEETVINLTVKKGMKNGWFGTVEGGYGTDDRYQATFNVNRFWNDNQITFLGSANNTNDLGFTDGKITANGKSVTKILIDGKEFFSDDPKVASKNLPVNMVAASTSTWARRR